MSSFPSSREEKGYISILLSPLVSPRASPHDSDTSPYPHTKEDVAVVLLDPTAGGERECGTDIRDSVSSFSRDHMKISHGTWAYLLLWSLSVNKRGYPIYLLLYNNDPKLSGLQVQLFHYVAQFISQEFRQGSAGRPLNFTWLQLGPLSDTRLAARLL